MQFTEDEWLAFAEKLERATEAEKLIWSLDTTSLAGNVYRTVVPHSAIYSLYSRDADDQFPYVLEVANIDGTKLSEFTTVAYADGWSASDAEKTSVVIDRLYSRVERLVTGAPQKVQSLLEGLDNLLADDDMPF